MMYRLAYCIGAIATAGAFVAIIVFVVTLAACAFSSCGSMDLTELARIRAITCPSVCAAYADVVDAGHAISPEDEALIGVCECGVGE